MGMKWSKPKSATLEAQAATDKKQAEQMKSMQKAMMSMTMQIMKLQSASTSTSTETEG